MKKNHVTELIQPREFHVHFSAPPTLSYHIGDSLLNIQGEFKNHLTGILREGARKLVLQAVETEFALFLRSHKHKELEDSCKQIVRHVHLPVRRVVTGIGAMLVKVPRSRDCKASDK